MNRALFFSVLKLTLIFASLVARTGVAHAGPQDKLMIASSVESTGSDASEPRELKLVEEDVDISRCPKSIEHTGKTYSDHDFVTIGDLHANAGKLVFFLVREGIASFGSEEECQEFLSFYNNPVESRVFPLSSRTQYLINSMKFKRPPEVPNVRLIGDELSDRGYNDGITIQLLRKLSAAQPKFEIMVSNHGFEFLREMSGLPNALNNSPSFIQSQVSSIFSIRRVNFDRIIVNDIQKFIRETYLGHLKLVSATFQEKGPVVFTHAPTEPKIVYRAARSLGVATGNCDTVEKLEKNIFECSNKMNIEYLRLLRWGVDHPDDENNILRRNQLTLEIHDSITDLFWRRHSVLWDRNNGSWQTANGHDSRGEGVESTFELDTVLGKRYPFGGDPNKFNESIYVVLRPI